MAGNEDIPRNNGAVLNVSQVIKSVMSSASEAKYGALFINAKTALPIQTTLIDIGHAQPKTPMQPDNSIAHGVPNNIIMSKASKSMDMRFHWLQFRNAQGQFRYYWQQGPTNLANYCTKHHPTAHHISFHKEIIISKKYMDALRRPK